jgi:putative acetyltransferase
LDQPPLEMSIRPLKGEDWRDCHEIWRAPRVLWGTLGLPSQSEDEVREKVGNPPSSMHRFGAVVEDRVVGVATLGLARGRRSHTGYVGVSAHDDHRRRGIGQALMQAVLDLADNWLNLRRLELEVMVDNEAALNLYRNSGFEVEGRKRQAAFRAGRFVDTFVMGRLREPGE